MVERQPTWVLSVSLGVIAVITFFSGVILHSIARGQLEQKMLVLRSVPNVSLPLAPAQARRTPTAPRCSRRGRGRRPLSRGRITRCGARRCA
jgi:hypothetical protein